MVIEPKQQDCMVGMENTLDQTLAYWQQMIENSGPAGENYIYCISADSAFPVLDYVAQEKHITINLNHGSCHCSF